MADLRPVEEPLGLEDTMFRFREGLRELVVNSKPIITSLTVLAGESRRHARAVSELLCLHIEKAPPEYKLPALYLLDSIAKNIQGDYIRFFEQQLLEVFMRAYTSVDPSLHQAIQHLFHTWRGHFNPGLVQAIDVEIRRLGGPIYPPKRPAQPPQPPPSPPSPQGHGIYVNPKYLQAQQRQQLQHTDQPDNRLFHSSRPLADPWQDPRPLAANGRPLDGRDPFLGGRAVRGGHISAWNGNGDVEQEWMPGWQRAPLEGEWSAGAPSSPGREGSRGENGRPGIQARGLLQPGATPRGPPSPPEHPFDSGRGTKKRARPGALLEEEVAESLEVSESTSKIPAPIRSGSHQSLPTAPATPSSPQRPPKSIDPAPPDLLSESAAKLLAALAATLGSAQPGAPPVKAEPVEQQRPSLPTLVTPAEVQGSLGESHQLRGVPLGQGLHSPLTPQFVQQAPHEPPRFVPSPPPPAAPRPPLQPPLPPGPPPPHAHPAYQAPAPPQVGPPSLDPKQLELLTSLLASGAIPPRPPPQPPTTAAQYSGQPDPPPAATNGGAAPEAENFGTEFNLEKLKVRHESVLHALHGAFAHACKTCGLRFHDRDEYSAHLDAHFQKKRKVKAQRAVSRPWFVSAARWLSGADAAATENTSAFFQQEEAGDSEKEAQLCVPADEDQEVCTLCGEKLESFWSPEQDEWMYRGAVYLNADANGQVPEGEAPGPIVHAKCRSQEQAAARAAAGGAEIKGEVEHQQQPGKSPLLQPKPEPSDSWPAGGEDEEGQRKRARY